jgi:hypothetical protein
MAGLDVFSRATVMPDGRSGSPRKKQPSDQKDRDGCIEPSRKTRASVEPPNVSNAKTPRARIILPFLLPALAAIIIAICFIETAHVGRRMPYNDDDMMNLYRAWTKAPSQLVTENLTFAAGQRPLGAAFYRAQFALWGFRSQPLHGLVWMVLALNLYFAWRLFRRFGANNEAALLGLAIFALHGGLRDLSYNTGTLYDTFCCTFYVAALLVYLRARAQGTPGWKSLALFALLFVCALNSKEMAVSLPLVLLLWELVLHPPESWSLGVLVRRLIREWRGVIVSGALAAIFSLKALSSGSAVHGLIGYTPSWTWRRWLETTAEYLSLSFYAPHPAGPWFIACYVLAIGAAIVSVVMRARSFVAFALLWFPIALWPISFVPPRVSGYVLYIPLLLWALLAGVLLAYARRRIVASHGLFAGSSRVFLFLAVAVVLGALNRLRPNDPPRVEYSPVELTARQFRDLYPNLRGPSRLLFLHDPFRPDGWALLMTLRLLYRDIGIDIHRLSVPDQYPPLGKLPNYDHIFDYRDSRYIELDNSDTQLAITAHLLPGQSLGDYLTTTDKYINSYVVRDVLDGVGEGRWTGPDPEFQFKLKSAHDRRLAGRIFVARETLQQNGPKKIAWFVNGHQLAHTRYHSAGEKRVSLAVPESWLSTEGLTTIGMRVENPFTGQDQVKLGVLVMELGFR